MASPASSNSSTAATTSGLKSEQSSHHQTPTTPSTRNNIKKRSQILTSSGSSGGGYGYDNSSDASSELIVGSEESSELQTLMEQRCNQRKVSNRESAMRSHMHKQLLLDGMVAEVASLRAENYKMLIVLERATAGFLSVESENLVLRTQVMELQSRLRSLNEIIKCMGTCTNLDAAGDTGSNWGIGINMNMNMMPKMN